MYGHFEFTPNEETKKLIKETGESIAAASLSSAVIGFIAQIVKNGIFAPAVTKIEIDNSVPAQIYAVGKKDGAKAVYIHSKRSRMNLLPAIALAVFGLAVHYTVNHIPEEKDTINV